MKTKKDLYIQFWISPITKNKLLNVMKPEELHTFIGLAAYINDENECHPSLKTLMWVLGLKDISTVSKRIHRLELIRYKGQPVLMVKRSKAKNKKGLLVFKNNQYQLNNSLVSIFAESESNTIRRQQQTEEIASKRDKLANRLAFEQNGVGNNITKANY